MATPTDIAPARASGPVAALLVAATVVAGVWLAGGVITDKFRVAAALTGVWFLAAGALTLLVARRWRPLRWWVGGAYLVTAGVIGGYLFYSMNHSTTVRERLAGGPAMASGTFASGEHETRGTARVVRAADGRQVLTLAGFQTSPGPDLRVRLVPGRSTDGGAKGNLDLGALKGDRGDQQYALPAGAPTSDVSVVIWCRAFSAEFGTAYLAPA